MQFVQTLFKKIPLSFMVVVVAGVFLVACSDDPSREYDETKDWTAQQFYNEAKTAIGNSDYDLAIEHLGTLEIRFPFSAYAQQSQLEIIYLYYKNEDMDLAVASADRFIKINPTHPSVDYAYYLKGLANSKSGESFITRVLGVDRTERCQESIKQSFVTFRELVTRFPDSKYAADARLQMVVLRDGLAKKEVDIAKYYFSRGAYVASINRAQFAIDNFPRTPYIYDALGILARSYDQLDMHNMLESTVQIIKLNYPEHTVLKELKIKS